MLKFLDRMTRQWHHDSERSPAKNDNGQFQKWKVDYSIYELSRVRVK